MSKYILVHDLGTTGNKAVIVDENLELLASGYTPFQQYYPHANWVEQNPEEWWTAVVESTKEAFETSGVDPADIAVVSFSAQMMSQTPVSEDGELLVDRTAIWADCRSGEQAKRLEDSLGGLDECYKIHGVGWQSELHVINKLRWIKDNMPEVYNKTYKFLQAKEFIAQRLTGKYATEWGDASMCAYMDIKGRKLSEEIFEAAEIDMDKIPNVLEAHDIMGHITPEAAKITGLKAGTPVCLGSGDVICSDVGAGVVEHGMAYTYIGSANWTGVFREAPSTDPAVKMNCSTCLPWPNAYHLVLITAAGGIAQQWAKDDFYGLDDAVAEKLGVDIYDVMTDEVAKIAPGSDGLVFLPYLRGGGAPHFDINARGAYLGAVLPHTRGHFVRSLYEGISFNIRWLYELFESVNVPIFNLAEVRAIGGGVLSDVWMQIYADVNNLPFARVRNPQQATATGAAIMGGVGVGVWDSYPEAAKLAAISKRFTPNAEATAMYDQLYPVYKGAYPALKETFDKISEFQVKYMHEE
ncbi:MAG: FGGY-family carbohydrate kinase [Proteobacteria bacterium]|nr:FGGY-family carbohydrate kinase [Pseudomonadota bacterium]